LPWVRAAVVAADHVGRPRLPGGVEQLTVRRPSSGDGVALGLALAGGLGESDGDGEGEGDPAGAALPGCRSTAAEQPAASARPRTVLIRIVMRICVSPSS
jgi:hypothetical protein